MVIPFENITLMANAYNDVTIFVNLDNSVGNCNAAMIFIISIKTEIVINPWRRSQSVVSNSFVLNSNVLTIYRGQRKARVQRIARVPKP